MSEPVYNQAFYNAILAERRKLGANGGYIDIDQCKRTFDNALKSDKCHPEYMTNDTKGDQVAGVS